MVSVDARAVLGTHGLVAIVSRRRESTVTISSGQGRIRDAAAEGGCGALRGREDGGEEAGLSGPSRTEAGRGRRRSSLLDRRSQGRRRDMTGEVTGWTGDRR